MTSLETALLAVKAMDSKKGIDIQVIEISDISVLADYMVIATGSSSTHVKALVRTHGSCSTISMLSSMYLTTRRASSTTLTECGRTVNPLI